MIKLKPFMDFTSKKLQLRIVFTLFLAIFLLALATGTGMAQENVEAAKTTEAAAEATAEPAEATAEPEPEPYEVVDYRNFFGIDGRLIVWIISQLHLMFAAFVLAVPLFVVIIEVVGMKSGDIRYDNLAREFTKLLSAAFATTASLGGLLAFALYGLYPAFMRYMTDVFHPFMFIYALCFFGEVFCLYGYYYSWDLLSKTPKGK